MYGIGWLNSFIFALSAERKKNSYPFGRQPEIILIVSLRC